MKHTERKTLSKSSGWLGILALLICACTPVPEHCGDVYVSIEAGEQCPGNPGGHTHTWGDWVETTPATCTAPGVKTKTCTQDGTHKETEAIPKLAGTQCSGGGSVVDGGPLTFEGQTYRTVIIGGKRWMAENLNYNASGSVCYGNQAGNCTKYGRLYDWATVMGLPASCNSSNCASQVQSKHRGICPAGWHVPSDAEWTALTDAVGGVSTAGTKLKSKDGWNTGSGYKAGTDDYGFSALPGGFGGGYGGDFISAGYDGYWWSATESDAGGAWDRYMFHNYEHVNRYNNGKVSQFSLRCSQDYVR